MKSGDLEPLAAAATVDPVTHHVDRPLGLSEVLAETIRLYGERIAATIALGLVYTAATVASAYANDVVYVLVASLSFGLTFGAAARLAAGDSFTEAWSQVAVRLPILAVLSAAVAVPFVIAASYLILIVVAAAWLAVAGFAIPVTMLERDPESDSWFRRLSYALERSVRLARTEFLHAFGVNAALALIYLLVGIILTALLREVADNSTVVATALTQIVLAPFFFLGLSVLYLEQRTRVKAEAPQASQASEG
jgi:hypothetical protein